MIMNLTQNKYFKKTAFVFLLAVSLAYSCESNSENHQVQKEKEEVDIDSTVYVAIDTTANPVLLTALIAKIEDNDFSFLSDTIFGECLVFAYEKFDEETMEMENYVLKHEIEENPEKLENYYGTNLKQGLLNELYSLAETKKSVMNSMISVGMKNSEFDSSCVFEFGVFEGEYRLVRVYGVG